MQKIPKRTPEKVMHKDPEPTSLPSGAKANDSVTRRLMRGFGATALGPVVTTLVQLGSVPILLHVWGAAKYGDWLLLSAVPSYLTLSDLGFGDASGSDMSMRVAAGDRKGALETFQSSWVIVTVVSLAALLLACIPVWLIPWQSWLKLSSVSNVQAAKVLLVLAAYVVVSQQNSITESGYRSDGHFATGTFWIIILRLVEAVTAITVALFNGSLLEVASTYLIVRSVGTISYVLLLRQMSPWIRYGTGCVRLTTIQQLAVPALGFMAFPLGSALNLQGLMLVIGARLGPIAVVSFSTLRTLSRFNLQLILVVKFSLWPELSRAFGSGNIALARRLHRHACQAALGFSIFGGLLLWIVGPFLYRLWIRQSVGFDATCFDVLLLVVITNSLWDTSSVIPMSINAHGRIALMYSAAAALSLALAWVVVARFGTTGVAIALLAIDAWMTLLVIRISLHLVHDDLKSFVQSMFAIPRLRGRILLTAREL